MVLLHASGSLQPRLCSSKVRTKLKNADHKAREQILQEIDLDGFSDNQIEMLYALVFENKMRSDAQTAKVMPNSEKQPSGQSISLGEVKTIIDAELKNVLRLDNATVSERGSFQQYGLDSISGMQLVTRLEKTLGLEVPPRWLIDYGTIETLSEKIIETQQ